MDSSHRSRRRRPCPTASSLESARNSSFLDLHMRVYISERLRKIAVEQHIVSHTDRPQTANPGKVGAENVLSECFEFRERLPKSLFNSADCGLGLQRGCDDIDLIQKKVDREILFESVYVLH